MGDDWTCRPTKATGSAEFKMDPLHKLFRHKFGRCQAHVWYVLWLNGSTAANNNNNN